MRFSTLNSDGRESNVRYLKDEWIRNCPSFIFLPEHYREDGTCRHDEINCEQDGCTNKKSYREIYCKKHLVPAPGDF